MAYFNRGISGKHKRYCNSKNQIEKMAKRFGVEKVTLVGDRGMIKSAQIEDLSDEHFHYITAVTKPQIEKLIKDGILPQPRQFMAGIKI